MFKVLLERLRQGHRRFPFLKQQPVLPERFRGLPVLDAARSPDFDMASVSACPTGAVAGIGKEFTLDLGRCLFCADCNLAGPAGPVEFTNDYRLAVRHRDDLVLRDNCLHLAEALDRKAKSIFGRSLQLRQVSAGGCNACEADINVLNTLTYDLGSYGIQFVASPRHADGLLVTGPVTANMRLALEKTWQAVPEPKIVIAVGACAISGGPYRDHPETSNGVDSILPVDLYIPGCPPHPWTILDGLLRLLGRVR